MDYEILGNNMQSLKLHLSEGESILSDSGKLVSKEENVIMTPRAIGGLVGMLERGATGVSKLLTEFKATKGDGTVEVAGVFPGKIMAIDLKPGERFVVEHFAFLACPEGMKFTITPVSIGAAFFGGAGLVLQEFIGPGTIFIHTSGDTIVYELEGTKTLELEPGHLAGFDYGITYSVRFIDNIRSALFGGAGLFLATFKGKGRVVTHSVSRFKFSGEVFIEGQAQEKGKGTTAVS
jgi:uncharacterized protein (TIGR00266 family)